MNNIDQCPNCRKNRFEVLYSPKEYKNYIESRNIYICKNCGLFFRNLKMNDINYINELNKSYYNNYEINALIHRSESRAIFDKSRAHFYSNYINESTSLKNKKNSIDIGGAEGWFSNLLDIENKKLKTHNIDPDKNVIKVGKKLYPNVQQLALRLEDIDKIKFKIDLLTYWGGLYRTAELDKVVEKLWNKCNEKADLFFSLPFTFTNPKLQNNSHRDSLSNLLNTLGVITYLNEDYLVSILSKGFKLKKKKYLQNYPFRKKIPFLHFVKKEKIEKKIRYFKIDYKINIKYIQNYAYELSRQNIKNFIKINKYKKIVIWFSDDNNQLIEFFKELKNKKILYVKEEDWKKSNKNINIVDIYKFKPDCLFILDFNKQNEIIEQVKNRIKLNEFTDIVKMKKNNDTAVFTKISDAKCLDDVLTPCKI